ncbi:MAG: hypothetical protein IJ682_09215 [Lachnospiraceae bacterium]|nr:hypothetical protein [Lachnospiraceae bacterium]
MLAALQGRIQGNSIVSDDLRPFSGRTVTIIINEPTKELSVADQRTEYLAWHSANAKPTGRTAEEIDSYIKEMRDNDRF